LVLFFRKERLLQIFEPCPWLFPALRTFGAATKANKHYFLAMITRETRVNMLIGTNHCLSHFYSLTLPPLFIVWQAAFHASFSELGLSVAVMALASASLQTPYGFLVDRSGRWWCSRSSRAPAMR
jgi:hypothetical protein